MQGCPFHSGSSGRSERGDIVKVTCPVCGEYRISEIAIARLADQPPPGTRWAQIVSRRPLISTRDLYA